MPLCDKVFCILLTTLPLWSTNKDEDNPHGSDSKKRNHTDTELPKCAVNVILHDRSISDQQKGEKSQ